MSSAGDDVERKNGKQEVVRLKKDDKKDCRDQIPYL